MSERLNREAVERQIREMWDALIDQVDATDPEANAQLDQAKEQARQCEQRLRERLDAQDRLDAAAPKLLEALEAVEGLLGMSDCESPNFRDSCADVIGELWIIEPLIRGAIAQAKGIQHEKQNS